MTFAKRDRDIGFGADPNNSFWAKDKNKFGLKMLEKMGWSDGKGLRDAFFLKKKNQKQSFFKILIIYIFKLFLFYFCGGRFGSKRNWYYNSHSSEKESR